MSHPPSPPLPAAAPCSLPVIPQTGGGKLEARHFHDIIIARRIIYIYIYIYIYTSLARTTWYDTRYIYIPIYRVLYNMASNGHIIHDSQKAEGTKNQARGRTISPW